MSAHVANAPADLKQACYHCQQPVPKGLNLFVELDGVEQPMCCYGCQAVAETIAEQGLEDFYKYRELDGGPLPLIPEALEGIDDTLNTYDDPDIQREFVHHSEHEQSVTLAIEGMTCAACAWLIEKQLVNKPGINSVVVNSTTERVQVNWQDGSLKLSDILRAIHRVGYKALPFQQADNEAVFEKQKRGYIRRLGVAGLASMQTMMVAFGLYFDDIDDTTRLYFWWLSLLFTAPVIVYSCQPFFRNATRALKARTLNMDVPVSLAMIFAFIASFYATVRDTGQVYYECVTMFAFFLLSGRFLELIARHRAVTNAANLMKLIPAFADKQEGDDWSTVMIKYLQAGDIIRVKPGTTIPVDGVLLSEESWADESMLTGESRPVRKQTGEPVYAGSLNQNNPVRIQVTHTQQDTLLAGIIQLQDSALGQKPGFVRLADHISRYFVLGTLIVASATYIGWQFVAPEQAFWVTLAVLVATCPCALALAAPTAMSGAVSRLNRAGILMKQASLVEVIPKIRTVCVDKTGTLTEGRFSITKRWLRNGTEDLAESLAAGLEQSSEHPLAMPLQKLASPAQVEAIINTPGKGLEGDYQGKPVRIGSVSYIRELLPEFQPELEHANAILMLAGEVVGEWVVDDQLRSDAKATLDWLAAKGIEIVMLTGDAAPRAEKVAEALSIKRVFSALKPEDKLEKLAELQRKGPVMMIGDGINDGPVLAQADGSVTFGSGADLAQTGSDVVILNNQLSSLRNLFVTAHQTRRIIRQNFAWALGYNGVILPLAVTGFVGPLLAMLGMSASSLIVLTNSLRLMRPARV